MAKTFKDLLLALLNATLILLALCLFLGWKLMQSAENLRQGFEESLTILAPLREQASGIREELAGLRQDIASLKAAGAALDAADQFRLNTALQRLDTLQEKWGDAQSKLAGLANRPEDLIDHAITTSAETVVNGVNVLRGCQPVS